MKCFFKKGGEGGAGERAGGRAKRMCHRPRKVQGYSPKLCGRIPDWRSQRNFAASRPCVCARGSVSECARVAGRARERAGVGAGWVEEKGEAWVREGT